MHWIHLLAAVTWIGGVIFNLLVLTPNLAALELKPRATLARRVIGRFLHIAWGSILLLAVTGLFRVLAVNRMVSLEAFTASPYGHALMGKLGLVVGMIAVASYITLSLYPKITSHLGEHESGIGLGQGCPICQGMLRRLRRLMSAVLGLGLVVILLAASLRGA